MDLSRRAVFALHVQPASSAASAVHTSSAANATLALMAAHGVDVRRAVTLVPRYTTVYKKKLVNAHIANLPADALLVYPDVDEFFEYILAG